MTTENNEPIYYFTSGLDADEMPLVEAHKSWPGGHQTQPVSVHDTLTDAMTAETALVTQKQEQGLEAAMREAERQAVAHDFLDPARADGRLFTEGPPDPFTTVRQAELAGLNYTYDIVSQPQGTFELQSIKTWQVEGAGGLQALPLGEYDRPADAHAEQTMLQAMGQANLLADRADPRLFTDGPPDPFTTQRQAELEASMGYTFRAGPALDQGETVEAYSLNLVNVERDGADYRFAQVEYLRVDAGDAEYVTDAAGRFNRMAAEHGIGPTAAAAGTWAREHGAEPSLEWREVTAAQLDRRVEGTQLTREMDTEPLPAAPDLER
jgi:hypothetical protein